MRFGYLLALLLLAGCASYAGGNVVPGSAAPGPARSPDVVTISENDITGRRYEVLGDVNVTVRKTTIFNADPTRELVNQALQREAAKLGADAVILVRYGTVGIDPFSWGRLDGNGRAIRFGN